MKNMIRAILAMVCVVALIASGSYAWEQILAHTNEFIGERTPDDDVVLHDDFEPGVNKKDVYVENTGNVTLFVRIKLDEAMSLVSNKWRPKADSSDWVTHKYDTVNESAIDCGNSNAASELFHDYFTWTMGGWKYYKSTNESRTVVQDINEYNGTEDGVKKTPDATIIYYDEFLNMEPAAQKAFIGWIFTSDGYAYWSQPLKEGQATGLLLHGVTTSSSLKDKDYYYAININLEAVDIKDIPMWTDGAEPQNEGGAQHPEASEDGKDVIYIIIGNNDDEGDDDSDSDNDSDNDGDDDFKEPGDGGEIPVNKPGDGFSPILNADAMLGDGYYSKFHFLKPDDPEENKWFHDGAIHLEDIITDGNYSVTAKALASKYEDYITIGTCDRHGDKPSIIFSYRPTKEEFISAIVASDLDVKTPVQVKLTRGEGETATITINMNYRDCMVSLD